MKRFTLCFVAVLIFFDMGVTCLASYPAYVGNKSTKVYHIAECTHAGKISSTNRIYFSSRSEAEANGYRRCYYCGDGVVDPGHGGDGGSGSGVHSKSPSGVSGSHQATAKKTQNENRTTWEDPWEIIRIILILVLAVAWPVTISIPFYAIYQMIVWFQNKKRKKTSSNDATECETSQVACGSTPTKRQTSSCKLESSVISKAEFEDGVLYVTFTNGGVFAYYKIPKSVYNELIRARSPGKYFHEKIDGVYPCAPYHE